jgi:cell division protein FtsL
VIVLRYGEAVTKDVVSSSFRKICPFIIIFTLSVFGLFMGLGVLRLYSFRLECRLNAINRQIESYKADRIILKHQVSSLLSPARIYGFSKKELGMTFASNVRVLRVEEHLFADRSVEGRPENLTEKGTEGWFYFFLEKAMAGN